MAATLYDLFWLHPDPAPGGPAVALTSGNAVDIAPTLPAVILYPAMLTPGVLAGDGARVELLIAVKNSGLRATHVNLQLKVSEGLNPARRYRTRPLFPGLVDGDDRIRVRLSVPITDDWILSHEQFAGALDPRALAMYQAAGYRVVHAVSIDAAMLDAATGDGETREQNSRDADGYRVAPARADLQDHIVAQAVANEAAGSESNPRRRLPRRGLYGFPVADHDVTVGPLDKDALVQAFHPLFKFDGLQYASIGHLSDIHVSSRQQILAKSQVRVIEYPDDPDLKPLGGMVNICSKDTKHVLDAFRADSNVDLIVLGGDLVDFIKNVHLLNMHGHRWSVADIWGAMNMEDRSYYRDNVDFLSVYSLLLEHYSADPTKPVYAITGNHDAYYEPYGISPRVLGLKRANDGIPADHNLTIYEAALAFGSTYGKLLTVPRSSFHAEKLGWFYRVFTPFRDFSVRLPKQVLVGLGWGEDEVLLSSSRPGGQGMGHLPWANQAVSDRQLEFLRDHALQNRGDRKVVLTTHFTFASYAESISNHEADDVHWGDANDQGDIYYTNAWYSSRDHSLADMGTFEENREALYAGILAGERSVQIVLTGHSHRRGFYTMRRIDTHGNNSIKTGFHDFPPFRADGTPNLPIGADRQEPYVILSDSGGSIPRCNLYGEFRGWGSDPPGGTRIRIDASGKITEVAPVRTPVKPRFVVALDYLDILVAPVIRRFETDEVPIANESGAGFTYVVNLEFSDEIAGRDRAWVYDLNVTSVRLFWREPDAADPRAGRWHRIALERAGSTRWRVPAGDTWLLRDHLWREQRRVLFAAIGFSSGAPHLQRYDFSTPWTFEIKVQREASGGVPIFRDPTHVKYLIVRDDDRREIPDFASRIRYWDPAAR